MSGKELYDTLIWAWEQHLRPRQTSNYWSQQREDGFLMPTPPAWPFLSERERGAFQQAAKALTPEEEK